MLADVACSLSACVAAGASLCSNHLQRATGCPVSSPRDELRVRAECNAGRDVRRRGPFRRKRQAEWNFSTPVDTIIEVVQQQVSRIAAAFVTVVFCAPSLISVAQGFRPASAFFLVYLRQLSY
jgi:hypothetical protein